MAQVVEQIKQVADSPLTILIEGETAPARSSWPGRSIS